MNKNNPSKKSEKKPKGGDKKKKKKRTKSYSSYLHELLKQVHPGTGISSKAMSIMNSFMHDALERIGVEAGKLVKYNKKATLSSREVQTAVRLILPGELAKHAVSEGTKAVTKYTSNAGAGTKKSKGGRGGNKKKPTSRNAKSGLTVSVSRVHRAMKTFKLSKRYGAGGPVYLTAVLEYLAAEVLELAGNACKDNKKKRVTPRHLVLAVRNDEELNKFLSGVTIASGGVLPNIHSVLLPKKSKSKADPTHAPKPAAPKAAASKPAAPLPPNSIHHYSKAKDAEYETIVTDTVAESACNSHGVEVLENGDWKKTLEQSDGIYVLKSGNNLQAFLVYQKSRSKNFPDSFAKLVWRGPVKKQGKTRNQQLKTEEAVKRLIEFVKADPKTARVVEIAVMCKTKGAERTIIDELLDRFKGEQLNPGDIIYAGATRGPVGDKGPTDGWKRMGFTHYDTMTVTEGKYQQNIMVKKV